LDQLPHFTNLPENLPYNNIAEVSRTGIPQAPVHHIAPSVVSLQTLLPSLPSLPSWPQPERLLRGGDSKQSAFSSNLQKATSSFTSENHNISNHNIPAISELPLPQSTQNISPPLVSTIIPSSPLKAINIDIPESPSITPLDDPTDLDVPLPPPLESYEEKKRSSSVSSPLDTKREEKGRTSGSGNLMEEIQRAAAMRGRTDRPVVIREIKQRPQPIGQGSFMDEIREKLKARRDALTGAQKLEKNKADTVPNPQERITIENHLSGNRSRRSSTLPILPVSSRHDGEEWDENDEN